MPPQFKTGIFTKTADPGPVNQSVSWSTGGNWPTAIAPNAVILWSVGDTIDNTWDHENSVSFGFFDETGAGQCYWTGVTDSGAYSNGFSDSASRTNMFYVGDCAYPGGLANGSICQWVSYDTNGFTLRWIANHPSERRIHYLALKVDRAVHRRWVINSGEQTIAGVGFCADLLFNIVFVGAGDPGDANGHHAGLGMANHALEQWAFAVEAADMWTNGYHTAHTRAARAQRFGRCAFLTDNGGYDQTPAISIDAEITGFTNDGWTYTGRLGGGDLGGGWATAVSSLVLKGVASQIGASIKPAGGSAATQTFPLTGMASPKALLLGSFQEAPQPNSIHHARFGFGVWDGTSQHAIALDAQNDHMSATFGAFDFYAVGNAHQISKSDRIFIKVNNSPPGPEPAAGPHILAPEIEALAVGGSLSSTAASIVWDPQDDESPEMLYCVLGIGTHGMCAPPVLAVLGPPEGCAPPFTPPPCDQECPPEPDVHMTMSLLTQVRARQRRLRRPRVRPRITGPVGFRTALWVLGIAGPPMVKPPDLALIPPGATFTSLLCDQYCPPEPAVPTCSAPLGLFVLGQTCLGDLPPASRMPRARSRQHAR